MSTVTWRVPGRVEVLGKHTDYAGGNVLICAIDLGVTVTGPEGEASKILRGAKKSSEKRVVAVDIGRCCA